MTAPLQNFDMPLPPGTGPTDLIITAIVCGSTDAATSPGPTLTSLADGWVLIGSVGPILVPDAGPSIGYFMRVYALVGGTPATDFVSFTSAPDATVWSGGCLRFTGYDPTSAYVASSVMVTSPSTAPSTLVIPSIDIPAVPTELLYILGGIYFQPQQPTGTPDDMALVANCDSGNHIPSSQLAFFGMNTTSQGATGDYSSTNDVRASGLMLAIVPNDCLDNKIQNIGTNWIIGTD
jgi:hypothetical protein